MNEDDRGSSDETECLPAGNRFRADVAPRVAIDRTVKFRTIVSQSPQPSICQSLADAGAHFRAGQHAGAKRTTPGEPPSLRQRYDSGHGPNRLRP